MVSRHDAIARYMSDALGEPKRVASEAANNACRHERQFRRDFADVLDAGAPSPRWRTVEVAGPMFYRTYGELAVPDQPMVVLMPHQGCFVSGLFHLHRFAPTDRPLCALRRAGGPADTERLFARLGDVGPGVALLDDAAAKRAYAVLRRGGVLFSFVDVVSERSDPVPLFGIPAALPDGPVRLGALVGARLTFLVVTDAEPGRLRVTLTEPIELTPDTVREAMAWVAHQLEQAIRAAPAQWLNWIMLGELWKQGTRLGNQTIPTASSLAA